MRLSSHYTSPRHLHKDRIGYKESKELIKVELSEKEMNFLFFNQENRLSRHYVAGSAVFRLNRAQEPDEPIVLTKF